MDEIEKNKLSFIKIIFLVFIIITSIVSYFLSNSFLFHRTNDKSVFIKKLKEEANKNYKLLINFDDLGISKDIHIIGGGRLNQENTNDTSSNKCFVVHGADYTSIKKFLNSDDFKNPDNTIIISSLALKICLLQEDEALDMYLSNFKGSGNIFDSSQKVFYYLDELIFHVKENFSGVVISFPKGYYFSKVKNYGLAHLIDNDFSLKGLENPLNFLEQIHFPKPKGFSGTFANLIQLAKEEYHEKFLKNIVKMDKNMGIIIPKNLLPFTAPKKSAKKLPLFEIIKLADNVYYSAIEKVAH